MQYDLFISHSSRDKDEVARPLAQALEDRGLQVWLDEEQLQVGDSIRRGIDAALRQSRFGLVVLSPAYLNSEWGQKELDAFFAKEKYNTKSILPIYHGISIEDVEQHWPMLADKISLNTIEGIEQLADKIQQSIQSGPSKPARLAPLKNKPWWPSNNWQWLTGITLVLGAIVIPIWHSTLNPSNTGVVASRGNNITIIHGNDNLTNNSYISPNDGLSSKQRRVVEFKKIDNLELALQELSFPQDPPTISVTLISQNWPIHIKFTVSKSMSLAELESSIISQLSLFKHVELNLPRMSSGCFNRISWNSLINGRDYLLNDGVSSTFESAKIPNNAIMQFQLRIVLQCSGG